MLAKRVKIVVAVVLLSACSSHRSIRAATPSPVSPSASASSTAPALTDPGAGPSTNETTIAAAASDADVVEHTLSLKRLSPQAKKLIVRWDCRGGGTFSFSLDGVQRASGPCGSEVVSATMPVTKNHPKVLTLDTPGVDAWRVSVSEAD